jgi:dipeptidase D
MNPKTQEILDYFKAISAIPRCSGKEENISQWLQQWAVENGFKVKSDSSGNLKITTAASNGYENAPLIVLQGHMDMVCEKSPDSDHDFTKDPIQLIYDGDWLRADKTTLGADNGIALALGMALVSDAGVEHPAIELLFTVNEETGLNGAKKLDAGFIDGKIMLNVDSETEGVFTVGCAGGQHTRIHKDLTFENLTESFVLFKITVRGLKGGHSGIDIHRRRANANKILGRALSHINAVCGIRLVSIQGGTAHNAIPRDAVATVACESARIKTMQQIISDFKQTVQSEYAATEKSLMLSLLQLENSKESKFALTVEDTACVINLLLAIPHGARDMSLVFENLVETSNNLATVTAAAEDSSLHILTSQRSSVISKLAEMTTTVEATAALAGAATSRDNGYPPWQPDMDSLLLQRCKNLYKQQFGRKPIIKAVHAGLECAIIGSKYAGMDMISLGPTIENPHSPDERLHIPSIERVWTFLVALLKSYGK